jgi:hypothetical protein
MEISHHLHPEAIENGMEIDDQFFTICDECVQALSMWIDPQLDSDIDIVPAGRGLFK